MLRGTTIYLLASSVTLTFATTCSQDGSSYSYTESVSSDQKTRTITTNFCPNHPYYNLNPNYAVSASTQFTVPAKPELKGATNAADPLASSADYVKDLTGQGGSAGVLFNGAMLYSPFAGSVALSGHSTSATYLEGNTFDQCGCHASSTTQASYHCHVPPNCLMYQLGGNAISTTAHSPQVGWAADGFPVYGPHGPSGTMMKTCTNSGGTYGTDVCTDNCGGYYKDDDSIDNFKYRYYIQGEYAAGNSCNAPGCPSPLQAYYPNTPICYRGCCPSGVTCSVGNVNLAACAGSESDGFTSSYTPSTTSSNGAAGAGADMASGLSLNTGGCACSSITGATCADANQDWESNTVRNEANSCPDSNPGIKAVLSMFPIMVGLVAALLPFF